LEEVQELLALACAVRPISVHMAFMASGSAALTFCACSMYTQMRCPCCSRARDGQGIVVKPLGPNLSHPCATMAVGTVVVHWWWQWAHSGGALGRTAVTIQGLSVWPYKPTVTALSSQQEE